MNRRSFISSTTIAGAALGLSFPVAARPAQTRIGIIGLDTSHAIVFTKYFNVAHADGNFRVVAAYPHGSADIESSVSRIPKYTDEIKALGVEIVPSIARLLEKVDVVLLETNDGRLHKEQAFQVFNARKPVFIDKPVAATFADVQLIYKRAREMSVPVFSASSLRYMPACEQVVRDKAIGKVLGADTFSPAVIEPTHADLFWYGIHGVELLYTMLGPGCESVTRFYKDDMEVVVGLWSDGRIGTFRGTRAGKYDYGGTAFGENGNISIAMSNAYDALCDRIVDFFTTKKSPVPDAETLEIYAFMQAADESRKRGGAAVKIKEVMNR